MSLPKEIENAPQALPKIPGMTLTEAKKQHAQYLKCAPVYRKIDAALGPLVPTTAKLAVWKITQEMCEATIKRVVHDFTGV